MTIIVTLLSDNLVAIQVLICDTRTYYITTISFTQAGHVSTYRAIQVEIRRLIKPGSHQIVAEAGSIVGENALF